VSTGNTPHSPVPRPPPRPNALLLDTMVRFKVSEARPVNGLMAPPDRHLAGSAGSTRGREDHIGETRSTGGERVSARRGAQGPASHRGDAAGVGCRNCTCDATTARSDGEGHIHTADRVVVGITHDHARLSRYGGTRSCGLTIAGIAHHLGRSAGRASGAERHIGQPCSAGRERVRAGRRAQGPATYRGNAATASDR
jgi:hypothetical protein